MSSILFLKIKKSWSEATDQLRDHRRTTAGSVYSYESNLDTLPDIAVAFFSASKSL